MADQLRRITTEFNFGNLLMLLQFGNMDRQTTMYNTRMFAERVMPQLVLAKKRPSCSARTRRPMPIRCSHPTARMPTAGRSWSRARTRPPPVSCGRSAKRGLLKGLHRVTAPTLLLWGAADKVVPPSYAQRFTDRMMAKTVIRSVAGGGHLLELDQPQAAAAAVIEFVS